MARGVGSLGLRDICIGVALPLIAAGAVGLLGVAATSPGQGQVPLLMNPETAVQKPHQPISVMIVGDSITQGLEGDWTWRYRIWEWFKDQDVKVRRTAMPVSRIR
jgi:hypothetical protein